MSVVYALIARQQSVLCEFTDKSGNFPTVTRVVLKHLAQQQGADSGSTASPGATKSVFPYNEFNFFFLHEEGLTYMCMAEEQVQTNVAFAMLTELRDAFVEHYGEQGKTALAFGMMPFAPTLAALMKKYDNYKIETPLSQVRTYQRVLVGATAVCPNSRGVHFPACRSGRKWKKSRWS